MFSFLKKVCVIAAHPDDEVLGCGGTIKKLTDNGCKVSILILGEGITSRRKERDRDADQDALRKLHSCCRKASRILGVESVKIKDFPDNRFDSVDLLDIVKVIEEFLSDVMPDAVLTHHPGDLNVDHQITNHAVLTACRPTSPWSPNYLLTFDVLSSTEWNFGSRGNIFTPNVFCNVKKEIKTKVKALKCYDSELIPFPFPRSPDAIECQAKRYGAVSNLPAAEAFNLIFFRYK